jgi:hypothetical protein
MNKLVKRYIVLAIVILIPLLGAYLIGTYGYNSEKFGQGAWKDEFTNDYLGFADVGTIDEQIDEYIKFGINSQYHLYDSEPIFSTQVKNALQEDLFKIKIYRSIYKTMVDEVSVDRVQYLYFIYDVQYLKLRTEFGGGDALQREIADADVPQLSINIYEVDEDDIVGTKDFVSQTTSTVLFDEGADVDYVTGENQDPDSDVTITADLNYVWTGFEPAIDSEWSSKTKIEVVAEIDGVTDVDSENIKTTVFETILLNYECEPANVDTADFLESYQQTPENMGYAKWAVSHYLWWICLITLVALGFITGSFYLVWLSEETKLQTKPVKKAKK